MCSLCNAYISATLVRCHSSPLQPDAALARYNRGRNNGHIVETSSGREGTPYVFILVVCVGREFIGAYSALDVLLVQFDKHADAFAV